MKRRNIPSESFMESGMVTPEVKRLLAPKITPRWVLFNTVPRMAEQAVQAAFTPLHMWLAAGARIAVQNRKLIVGM